MTARQVLESFKKERAELCRQIVCGFRVGRTSDELNERLGEIFGKFEKDIENRILEEEVKAGKKVEYEISIPTSKAGDVIKKSVHGLSVKSPYVAVRSLDGGMWSIDHIPTGYVMHSYGLKRKALFVAKQIHNAFGERLNFADPSKAGDRKIFPKHFKRFLFENETDTITYEDWLKKVEEEEQTIHGD